MMAASPRMRNALTLFSSVDDVLCHRVRLVLAAKGVTYDLITVDPKDPPEDLIDLNPYHSVPTLVERDLVLYASTVVTEYLDERYPHPPLMPVDPLSRAYLRQAMYRINRDWVESAKIIETSTGPKKVAAAKKQLREEIIASDELFGLKPFLLSDELTLVDCALTPLLWRLPAYDVEL